MTEQEKARVVRDTEPEALRPVLDAVSHLETVVAENDRTIKGALSGLRTTVLQHYHAMQSRLDEHAREIRQIKDFLRLPPLPPEDSPRALPADDVAAE